MKKGYMFITRTGYDPAKGKHIKDPFLSGSIPTFGACMPNVRKYVEVGDSIFAISGKAPGLPQFIMGCFEVAEKIHMSEAYTRFPEQRLKKRDDGQLAGNIIVNADGSQHALDNHKNFDDRLENYIVGRNLITLATADEIARGRAETMKILEDLFGKTGRKPLDIIGRMRKLNEEQVDKLRRWLFSLKEAEKQIARYASVGRSDRPFATLP